MESKLLLSLVSCSSCTGVHQPPPLRPVTDSCVPCMDQFTNSWDSQSGQKGPCPPNTGNLCSVPECRFWSEGHCYRTFLHCCMPLLLWPKWPPRCSKAWNHYSLPHYYSICFLLLGARYLLVGHSKAATYTVVKKLESLYSCQKEADQKRSDKTLSLHISLILITEMTYSNQKN